MLFLCLQAKEGIIMRPRPVIIFLHSSLLIQGTLFLTFKLFLPLLVYKYGQFHSILPFFAVSILLGLYSKFLWTRYELWKFLITTLYSQNHVAFTVLYCFWMHIFTYYVVCLVKSRLSLASIERQFVVATPTCWP